MESDTTTVRVRRSTRDHLAEVGREEAMTVDAVINAALEALAWRKKGRAAEEAARRIAADPRERAEALAIMRDMEEWNAG